MEDRNEFAAALTIQSAKLLIQSMLDAVRKRAETKKMLPDVRSLSGELDVIVERVRPTFGSWEPGTLGHVSCNHGLEPNDNRQLVSDGIATVLSWFESFAARDGAEHEAAEPYIKRFEELNDLLFWTCRYAQLLGAMVESTQKGSGARASFKIVADHYNRFLTDYEMLLVKVADALQVPKPWPRLTFPRL